jgi:predicted nucleotidyltransferase
MKATILPESNKIMLTREAAIQVVKNFIHDLESTGVGLQKAVLFGSYAQNRQSEWSDIDLALVSEGFSGFGFEDSRKVDIVTKAALKEQIKDQILQATIFIE